MVKKLKIGVLMGGPSAEHEVSLATGKNVIDNLDRSKYQPVPIKLSKDNKAWRGTRQRPRSSGGPLRDAEPGLRWFLNGRLTNMAQALKSVDIVFNALHGTFGEDGRVQALLEYHGARYTGSGITASALAMDKLRSREFFKLAGFDVPKTLKVKKGENYQARLNLFINKITKLPVVVKPCCNGSSVGVSIVSNEKDLSPAIKDAFKFCSKVLVEEFIKGREITCGVLDNLNTTGEPAALPVTEITPVKKHKFYNYDAKYKDGYTEFATPAQIDEATYKKAQETAVRAHQLLGCCGYSRTDMILRNDKIFVLEINTLPGLTSHSSLPQAAKVAGLTFTQLLGKVIESSLV